MSSENLLMKSLFVLSIIGLSVVILLLPLRLWLYDSGFYSSLAEKSAVYDNLPEGAANSVYANVINFFQGDEPLVFFEESARDHMGDVRVLVSYFFIVLLLTLFITLVSLVALYFLDESYFERKLPVILFSSGIASIAFIVVFVLAATEFSSSLDFFHKAFFPQGNYLFPYESLILKVFPERFLGGFFVRMIITSSAMALCAILTAFILRKSAVTRKN